MLMKEIKNVAILIFEDVEILDFCGPFEVFSITARGTNLNVYMVAEKTTPILTYNKLSVNPHYSIFDCPEPDIVLIPGGKGSRKEMNNPIIINWIKSVSKNAELVLSVCTGAFLLAKADLLDNLEITTHHLSLEFLKEIAPSSAKVREGVRFIDNGKVVLSAGISAGIDMSLYIVERIFGKEKALNTASIMEYEWNPEHGVKLI